MPTPVGVRAHVPDPLPSDLGGEHRPKAVPPEAHRLVADGEAVEWSRGGKQGVGGSRGMLRRRFGGDLWMRSTNGAWRAGALGRTMATVADIRASEPAPEWRRKIASRAAVPIATAPGWSQMPS